MAPCYHAELEEAAFDRSVEQRDTPGRGQAQKSGKFQVGSKDMRGPAGVAFLQLVAELRIEGAERLRVSHAMTVGRIGDEHAGFGRRRKLCAF